MSYMDIIRTGGPIIIVILITAGIGLFFFFERLINLSVIKGAVRSGGENAFLDELEKKTPSAKRGVDEVHETVGLHCEKLYRNFRIITTAATISPLLGLLGTTTGMIKIFNTLENTERLQYAGKLAEGIGEALYTTIAGLIVAITLTILLGILKEMATGIRHDLIDHYVQRTIKSGRDTGKRML